MCNFDFKNLFAPIRLLRIYPQSAPRRLLQQSLQSKNHLSEEPVCVPKTASLLIALNINGDDRAALLFPDPVRLAVSSRRAGLRQKTRHSDIN